jgi:hypothetical protein
VGMLGWGRFVVNYIPCFSGTLHGFICFWAGGWLGIAIGLILRCGLGIPSIEKLNFFQKFNFWGEFPASRS